MKSDSFCELITIDAALYKSGAISRSYADALSEEGDMYFTCTGYRDTSYYSQLLSTALSYTKSCMTLNYDVIAIKFEHLALSESPFDIEGLTPVQHEASQQGYDRVLLRPAVHKIRESAFYKGKCLYVRDYSNDDTALVKTSRMLTVWKTVYDSGFSYSGEPESNTKIEMIRFINTGDLLF